MCAGYPSLLQHSAAQRQIQAAEPSIDARYIAASALISVAVSARS